MARAVLPVHGKDSHRCNGPDAIPVLVHLKIFLDDETADVGDNARRFVVTDDLGGTYLRSVNASVTTVGGSSTGIQVHNLTNADDVLSTICTIDTGETTSYTAATPHVVNQTGTPPINQVLRGDVLRIDVDDGSDALGLEALLEFGPDLIRIP